MECLCRMLVYTRRRLPQCRLTWSKSFVSTVIIQRTIHRSWSKATVLNGIEAQLFWKQRNIWCTTPKSTASTNEKNGLRSSWTHYKDTQAMDLATRYDEMRSYSLCLYSESYWNYSRGTSELRLRMVEWPQLRRQGMTSHQLVPSKQFLSL